MTLKGRLFEVTTEDSVSQRDLNWSFQYLHIWMKIIGIQPPQPESSKVKNGAILLSGFGIWLLTVSTNLGTLALFLRDYYFDYSTQSSIHFWNSFIEYCNWIVHAIGIQSIILFFFLQSTNKWVQLHRSLLQMESCTGLKSHPSIDFSMVRKLSVAGIIYVIFLVT